MDLFAPCAMGAILNDDTIARLKVGAIAGAANNQLAEERHAAVLREKGILYAPDYVINAGGIIDVYYQQQGDYKPAQVKEHIDTIGSTMQEVFQRADETGETTAHVADRVAEERFGHEDTLKNDTAAA